MNNTDRPPNALGNKLVFSTMFGVRGTKRNRPPPAASLGPPHNPLSLMGKLRKSKASPAASATPIPQDEAVLDDLFTQLDMQEKNKPPSGMTPSGASPATSSSEKKMTMNGAMSSAKARFKAREVRAMILYVHPPPPPSHIWQWQRAHIDTVGRPCRRVKCKRCRAAMWRLTLRMTPDLSKRRGKRSGISLEYATSWAWK
jgi:hypothetical protein